MTKYNEIMSRVSVTPEMRERVLSYVAEHQTTDAQAGHDRKPNIKKMAGWVPAVAAACLLAVVGLSVFHLRQAGNEPADVATYGIEEYDTLAALNAAMGFDVPEVSPLPFAPAKTVYENVFGVARIEYYGAGNENITLSMTKDNGEDISGDYNEYAFVREETINGVTVVLKGNEGSVSLAVWTMDGYAYAISANPGVDSDAMIAMTGSIIL